MSRQAWSHSAQAQAVDKVVATDEQTGETRVSNWTLRLSKDHQDVQAEEILIRQVADEEFFAVWLSSAPEQVRVP
ncbi:hypothetical protein [Streptomyces sp. C10-9-1]|uniref:hypothetical protein n=1 Tax=Streptomyces sp. C10-9-1 TaxID=1859285 RepID=UPI003D7091E8